MYNGVFYPFPYRGAERLTAINIVSPNHGDMYHLDEVAAFRHRNHSFEDILAYGLSLARIALARFLASQVRGVSAADPTPLGMVVLLITLARLWPSLRTASVEPTVALRYE